MHAEPQTLPEEETVPPGDDSNNDPTPPLPADPGHNTPPRSLSVVDAETRQATNDHRKTGVDVDNERDIPSDGHDLKGEAMIRMLGEPVESFPQKN